ncbi:DUF892 family protein [Natronolimnohabitans sp. A-GB9]|uniref:YciE/YciF ferroxidase family protein n=1 Tax=Natronolimnohabitans sp. A-GB9 TaxID=3069757 RepID=UPI0027B7BDF9|nr:DUF892 family protein [Natronolimnohabitans sp. A-GB9]MDQ2051585.1 DUF892 family protein [Natronolimnohabitans sp. A-GB9]
MSIDSTDDLFVSGLKHAYYTEQRLVDALEELEEFMSNDPSDEACDRFNIAAGQKSEHYEIATYGNLIPMADQLGMDDVADTLEQTLREEQDELDTLSEYGEQFDYGELEASD